MLIRRASGSEIGGSRSWLEDFSFILICPAGLACWTEKAKNVKKILFCIMCCLFAGVTLGCQPSHSDVAGTEKSYELAGGKVSFLAPPDNWKESLQQVTAEGAELGMPEGSLAAVTYRLDESTGFISVGAFGQKQDKDGKFVELENDQEMLDQIALRVIKRDGEIQKQEYRKVLGVNAFYMEFELKRGADSQKGAQVHFTKDGTYYALSLLVPAADYSASVGHFESLVESFKKIS